MTKIQITKTTNQSPASEPAHPEHDLPQFLVRANAAAQAGRIEEAIGLLNDDAVGVIRQIVEKDPSRMFVMYALATVFRKTGQLDRAEQWYKKILKHGPDDSAYNELGIICKAQGRLSEAIQYRRKALKKYPDDAGICNNLARDLLQAGEIQEGFDLLQKSVQKAPDHPDIRSNFLNHLHHLPDLDPRVIFDEHKQWGRLHAKPALAALSHNNDADPDRRLRVGYISPDFRIHSVAYFFEPLLDAHNHLAIEVYGYGNVAFPDQMTQRLERKFDRYRNIRGLGDETVASIIEQDQLDILVDLAGHSDGNRLLVLARKPAPIQVTYLGYPDTTGMQAVDYRLADSLADLPQSQKFHTEKLIFLSQGFLCYRPADFAPPVAPLPALRKGYITFGSFNNSCKVNPTIMALWAQILKANGDSRLLLKFRAGDDKGVRDNYFRQFERLGIPRDRVNICGFKPAVEHLQLYGQVDIALDTYPYNGTTTTCDALWMGVPVISLVGQCHVSRVGLSILSRVGLEFFAASAPEEYVARAVALAAKPNALAEIRDSMRQRMLSGKLCDAKGFARSVEEAYRKMWHRWCRYRGVDVPTDEFRLDVKRPACPMEPGA
jgi:predicted O-linked N-acetylglucosamine transferase (SPINDLY family)